MTFREAEIGEGREFLIDPVGDLTGDSVTVRHPGVEPAPQSPHLLRGTLGTHGPAKLVCLGG